MPTLADLARFFAALPTLETLVGLAITVTILVVIPDWRLSLLTLAVQYVLVGVLLSTAVRLEIALLRIISGALAAAMLYLAARQRVYREARRWRSASGPVFLIGWPFRAVALGMAAATVVAVADQFRFLDAPVLFWLSGLWLMAGGALLMTLTRDSLKLGLGLLTFASGFGALYLTVDPGLPLFALLNMSDLIVALGISHLTAAPEREHPRRRRGDM